MKSSQGEWKIAENCKLRSEVNSDESTQFLNRPRVDKQTKTRSSDAKEIENRGLGCSSEMEIKEKVQLSDGLFCQFLGWVKIKKCEVDLSFSKIHFSLHLPGLTSAWRWSSRFKLLFGCRRWDFNEIFCCLQTHTNKRREPSAFQDFGTFYLTRPTYSRSPELCRVQLNRRMIICMLMKERKNQFA